MDMRNKIASILWDYTDTPNKAYDGADAILAALMDMIPDLVWNNIIGNTWCARDALGREWAAWDTHFREPDGKSVAAEGGQEETKAAANAHHKAQLAKAMGWTV